VPLCPLVFLSAVEEHQNTTANERHINQDVSEWPWQMQKWRRQCWRQNARQPSPERQETSFRATFPHPPRALKVRLVVLRNRPRGKDSLWRPGWVQVPEPPLVIALAKFQTPPILRSAFHNFVLEDVKHFRFGQRFLFTVYDRKELPIRFLLCFGREESRFVDALL
jgi:hypothetical protein